LRLSFQGYRLKGISEFKVQGIGSRDLGLGIRVYKLLGFRVYGSGLSV
jgi:hypothetical protein